MSTCGIALSDRSLRTKSYCSQCFMVVVVVEGTSEKEEVATGFHGILRVYTGFANPHFATPPSSRNNNGKGGWPCRLKGVGTTSV